MSQAVDVTEIKSVALDRRIAPEIEAWMPAEHEGHRALILVLDGVICAEGIAVNCVFCGESKAEGIALERFGGLLGAKGELAFADLNSLEFKTSCEAVNSHGIFLAFKCVGVVGYTSAGREEDRSLILPDSGLPEIFKIG